MLGALAFFAVEALQTPGASQIPTVVTGPAGTGGPASSSTGTAPAPSLSSTTVPVSAKPAATTPANPSSTASAKTTSSSSKASDPAPKSPSQSGTGRDVVTPKIRDDGETNAKSGKGDSSNADTSQTGRHVSAGHVGGERGRAVSGKN